MEVPFPPRTSIQSVDALHILLTNGRETWEGEVLIRVPKGGKGSVEQGEKALSHVSVGMERWRQLVS